MVEKLPISQRCRRGFTVEGGARWEFCSAFSYSLTKLSQKPISIGAKVDVSQLVGADKKSPSKELYALATVPVNDGNVRARGPRVIRAF